MPELEINYLLFYCLLFILLLVLHGFVRFSLTQKKKENGAGKVQYFCPIDTHARQDCFSLYLQICVASAKAYIK